MKHLTIHSIERPLSLSSAPSKNAMKTFTQNFAQPQLGLFEAVTIPRYRGRYSNASNGRYYYGNVSDILATIFPDIFRDYHILRCNVHAKLIVTPTWNHTGLIGMCYSTPTFLNTTTSRSDILANLSEYCLNAYPHQRTFGRIGKDMEMELVIPYISNISGYVREVASSQASVNNAGYIGPTIYIVDVVPPRTIAGASQTIYVQLYYSLSDVVVGGYKGSYPQIDG